MHNNTLLELEQMPVRLLSDFEPTPNISRVWGVPGSATATRLPVGSAGLNKLLMHDKMGNQGMRERAVQAIQELSNYNHGASVHTMLSYALGAGATHSLSIYWPFRKGRDPALSGTQKVMWCAMLGVLACCGIEEITEHAPTPHVRGKLIWENVDPGVVGHMAGDKLPCDQRGVRAASHPDWRPGGESEGGRL